MVQTEQFFKYMQLVENAELLGGDLKQIIHNSPEGGLDTVGYGHKLNVLEKTTNTVYGMNLTNLTREQCDYILALDIDSFANALSQKVPDWKARSQRTQEMLVDYEFNLGSVERYFPKFYRGVLEKDIDTQRKEYKRYYHDSLGHRKELTRRNRHFYSRYLSPIALRGWDVSA